MLIFQFLTRARLINVVFRFYIPILRTLRSHSTALVEKLVQKVDLDETGQEVSRQELELVPKEKVLKYLPLGNYKW